MDARERERERLGRLVRQYWLEWAHEQPNAKPSWLLEWDQMAESDREADRVIGERLMHEFYAETTGERLNHELLKQIALKLSTKLHGYVMTFDEHDGESLKAIDDFEQFVGGVWIVNNQA